jgi:hypothetical protein
MHSTEAITNEEIAVHAHNIWDECGRPDGRELEFWLRAERELLIERQRAEELCAGLSCHELRDS